MPRPLILLLFVLFFGILTLWVPDYWPVAVFQIGAFAVCAVAIFADPDAGLKTLSLPGVALALAAGIACWQVVFNRTVTQFETTLAALSWVSLFALYAGGRSLFSGAQARSAFRKAVVWFTFAVSIEATLQTFTAEGKIFWIFPSGYTDFVMGPILYRNHYAAWIELIFPIALFEAFRSRRNSLLYAGMAAALYASVIASASRAGMVLCTAELILIPLLVIFRDLAPGRDVGSVLAKIGGGLALFTAVVGWETIWKRLMEPDPYFGRREFAIASLSMIRDRPWFGWGLGSWPTVYPGYAIIDLGTFANRAHNQWLEWASDGGIPFALLFLAVALWSIRAAYRTVWGLGVVAVFLHCIVDYPFSRPPLAAWPIAMIALMAATEAKNERATD